MRPCGSRRCSADGRAMMSELRWALLILGVLFIVALSFWERRRPRQASGAFGRRPPQESVAEPSPRAVREPPLTLPEVHVHEPLAAAQLPVVETSEETALPVLEPAADEIADNLPGAESAHELLPEESPLAKPQPRRAEDEDTIDDLPTIVMSAEHADAEHAAAGHADDDYPLEAAAFGP